MSTQNQNRAFGGILLLSASIVHVPGPGSVSISLLELIVFNLAAAVATPNNADNLRQSQDNLREVQGLRQAIDSEGKMRVPESSIARVDSGKIAASIPKPVNKSDQIEADLRQVVDLGYQNNQDNCAARAKIDDLEKRVREPEEGREIQPTSKLVRPRQPQPPKYWVWTRRVDVITYHYVLLRQTTYY